MRSLYLLSVAVHLLAAAWWIGGLLFLATGVVPVIRRPFFQAVSAEFMRQVGLQFRRLGWIALGLLVLSGLVNLLGRGVTPDRLLQPAFWSGPFGRALAGKLAAVALIFLFNALRDFWAGPRATQAMAADPGDREARRWRACASVLARLTLLASLGALFFAIVLVRGWP